MKLRISFALLLAAFLPASGEERFASGELKGFTKSPTEHIIERLDKLPIVPRIEGSVGSKELDKPLEGVLVEIRGPGDAVTFRSAVSDKQGRFRFGRVSDGDYTIKLTLNGFRSVVGAISVRRSIKPPQESKPLRIEMLLGV